MSSAPKNGGDFSLFPTIKRSSDTGGERGFIISNLAEDDRAYTDLKTTREDFEPEMITRITNLIRAVAKRVLGTIEISFDSVNIEKATDVQLQEQIGNDMRFVVFSGGPQNVRDTSPNHEPEISKLKAVLEDTLKKISNDALGDTRILTICLAHQALADVLKMEVERNKNNEIYRGQGLTQIRMPNRERPYNLYCQVNHAYHVKFKEIRNDYGLRVVEFATLPTVMDSAGKPMCYGFLVIDKNGMVRIVSLQFHPELGFDSYDSKIDDHEHEMSELIAEAFTQSFPPIEEESRQTA